MAIRGRRNRRFVFEDATVEYRKHASLSFLAGAPKVSPLVNLAIGGLQFVTEDYFEPGQRLDLRVILPNAFRSLTVRAEVVWAKRVIGRACYRTGVRYLDPSADVVGLLRSLEEYYWTVPDERKALLEARMARRYPIPTPEPEALERAAEDADTAAAEGATAREEGAEEVPEHEVLEELAPVDAALEAEAPPPTPAAQEPTPEASPAAEPPEAEPPHPEPCRIPLYDLVAGIQSRPDEAGGFVVQGIPTAHLILPGIADPDCFALEVHDDSMHHSGSPTFERGDIVVFSPNVPARSGDLAFAITRDGGVFRQVFFDANNILRLRPLNGWHPELSLPRGEVRGLWRLIGKYRKFVAE